MPSRSNKITSAAVLTAAGLILGYIESFIVLPVHVPGVRIGLANITTLIMLYLEGPLWALAVSLVRVTLSSLLFGTPVSFLYSFAGAVLALLGMILLKRFDFSVYSVSITGAVLHNFAQITVAMFFVGSSYVFIYVPVLMIAGIIAGLAVGYLSSVIIRRVEKRYKREGKT